MDETSIKNMGKDIQAYLEKEKIVDAKPKHLMPLLIEKGYFKKDHRDGLPLRDILRELDRTNRLHLLPQVWVERKEINVYWYFNP